MLQPTSVVGMDGIRCRLMLVHLSVEWGESRLLKRSGWWGWSEFWNGAEMVYRIRGYGMLKRDLYCRSHGWLTFPASCCSRCRCLLPRTRYCTTFEGEALKLLLTANCSLGLVVWLNEVFFSFVMRVLSVGNFAVQLNQVYSLNMPINSTGFYFIHVLESGKN